MLVMILKCRLMVYRTNMSRKHFPYTGEQNFHGGFSLDIDDGRNRSQSICSDD